jgi:hypothetical protein
MLATLSQLKARLGVLDSDTTDDALFANFLKLVSARFAQHCRRTFDRDAAATFEFRGHELLILPDRYPIESVSAWHLKETEAEGWVVQSAPDYFLNERKNIIELISPLGVSTELARVTHAGGYVLPGDTASAGQTELPDDLRESCIEQAAYLYQNRKRLGLVSISGQGGSLSQFAELDLLPLVRATLDSHIRITI